MANTWKNISGALDKACVTYQQSVNSGTATWTGVAADAYRKGVASRLVQALRVTSTVSMVMSVVLVIASSVVSAVHDAVRDLISTVVGQIVQAVVEEGATLGLATPVVVAQVTGAVAENMPKAINLVDELVKAFESTFHSWSRLVTILGQLLQLIRSLAQNQNVQLPPVLGAPASI